MSIKSQASEIVKQYFDENADADSTITASQLADLVQRDAKTVRARLRKLNARNQAELKGARWHITKTLAQSELENYMRLDEKKVSEAN